MRNFLFLAMAGIADLLGALSQDLGATFPEIIDSGISGSTLDQPLPFESDLITYNGGTAAPPQQLNLADLDLPLDNAYLASLFSDKDDLDTSDESQILSYLWALTGTDSPDANIEAGYDEPVYAYEKAPLYTWPTDDNNVVFPFNCWKENRDGFVCSGDQCRMGMTIPLFSLIKLININWPLWITQHLSIYRRMLELAIAATNGMVQYVDIPPRQIMLEECSLPSNALLTLLWYRRSNRNVNWRR